MISEHAPKLSDSIKLICKGFINTMQLPEIYIGEVTKINPLHISISPQHVLSEKFLTLTNAVKDYDVDITVSWNTTDNEHKHGNGNQGQDTLPVTHNHAVQGRKKITVHNGLTLGEKVLLLRVQGGQNYIVIDRIDQIKTSGESV